MQHPLPAAAGSLWRMLQRHKAFGQVQGIALGIAASAAGWRAGVAHAPLGHAALQRSLWSQAATQATCLQVRRVSFCSGLAQPTQQRSVVEDACAVCWGWGCGTGVSCCPPEPGVGADR